MSYIKQLAVALTCLTLSACVPYLTPEEKKQAEAEYLGCLNEGVTRLDDGKSDAMTIGFAVQSLCASKFDRFLDGFAPMTPSQKRVFMEQYGRQKQNEMATTRVLLKRKKEAEKN